MGRGIFDFVVGQSLYKGTLLGKQVNFDLLRSAFVGQEMEMHTCRFSSISSGVSVPISFPNTVSAQTVVTTPSNTAYNA